MKFPTMTYGTNILDIQHLKPCGMLLALPMVLMLSVPSTVPVCPDCQIGKMPTRSFPSSDKRETKPLSMVHCDLVEFPVESYYWHKYCLTIIDDYSGYGTICLLHLKSDTAVAFQTWVTWAEKQMSHSLL